VWPAYREWRIEMVEIGKSIGDEEPWPDFGIQWCRNQPFLCAPAKGKRMRYKGERSFHFREKWQVRGLRLAGHVDCARQLRHQIATKIRDLVRKTQAPVAIFLTQGDGLGGANNVQAGGKVDQTPQRGDRYIHPLDERPRVTGVE